MREKLTALKLLQSSLRYLRHVNLLFKKNFRSAELLIKHTFFFALETVLKMAKETNKGDVKSMRAKVTKHIKKGGESWS